MEAMSEGGERGGGVRSRGMPGMVCRGSTEEGIPPGPWAPCEREGKPLWGETRDEETLPLLRNEESKLPNENSDPFLPGPWENKPLNPFDPDICLPLRRPLVTRDKLWDEQLNNVLCLNDSINPSFDLTLKMTPALFVKEKEALSEPSQEV